MLPVYVAYIIVVMSVLVPVLGWWTDEMKRPKLKARLLIVGLIITVAILLPVGVFEPLSLEELRELLKLVVTVSGIAGGLLFGFLVHGFYDTRRRALQVTKKLREKQRKLNLFREMCDRSTFYHEAWQEIDHRVAGLADEDFYRELEGLDHQYVYDLYRAIYKLSEGVYGDFHLYDEGRKLLTFDEIYEIKIWVNKIWYYTGGDTAYRTIQRYLQQRIGEARLTPPGFPLTAQREEFAEDEDDPDFPTFGEWCVISGDMELLCDEMLSLHRKLHHLSPSETFQSLQKLPYFFALGLLLPLLLLSFNYNLPPGIFSGLCYAVIGAFTFVSILLGGDLFSSFAQNFYREMVEGDDPRHVGS